MEAVQIDIYISDLLYSYDCVIVPDFGGFVANYAPAKIKEVQHQFMPPSKQISFNKNLTNNDGLLTNHISQRRQISFQEANLLIRAFVDRSLTGLKNGDKIKIDKVGELYLDPEGNIQFVEIENNDFLLDSFGLQSFRALPVQRDTVEEKIQEKLKSGQLLAKSSNGSGKVYWRAAAIVFFIASTLLFLDQKVDSSKLKGLQYSIFSTASKEDARYHSRSESLKVDRENTDLKESSSFENKGFVLYAPDGSESTSFWIAPEKREVEKKIDNTAVVNESENSAVLNFHVMGGCFSNYKNASNLTAKLSSLGYPSRMLGSYKSLHAVSYGSFSNREEAVAFLRKVQANHNSSAWLLEKRF